MRYEDWQISKTCPIVDVNRTFENVRRLRYRDRKAAKYPQRESGPRYQNKMKKRNRVIINLVIDFFFLLMLFRDIG